MLLGDFNLVAAGSQVYCAAPAERRVGHEGQHRSAWHRTSDERGIRGGHVASGPGPSDTNPLFRITQHGEEICVRLRRRGVAIVLGQTIAADMRTVEERAIEAGRILVLSLAGAGRSAHYVACIPSH